MAVSIGPRIQVDGEEEYRRQLNNIIQQAKTLDAEMAALTASFDKDATAQEKAEKSSEMLNKQLEISRQRTALVRDMTEKSAEATGENSAETLKWRQALAAAEQQQYQLEHAVQENTAAMEQQDAEMEKSDAEMVGLGDSLDTVAGKLGVKLPNSAKEALNGMEGFSAGTVAAMGAAAAAVAVVVKAAKELTDITIEQAAKADELLTRSAQTGLSTDLLQGIDYAQRFLDFGELDKTLVKLTQNMDKARDGAEKQAAAFETLGVSVVDEDGKLRDNWSTFLDVIDALGKVQNAAERDALANDVFGKSYTELKPLVDAGADALRGYVEEAQNMGYILENEAVEQLRDLDDAMQRNDVAANALKNTIATALSPAIQGLIELETGAMDLTRNGIENGWLDVILASTGQFGALAVGIKNTAEMIGSFGEAEREATERTGELSQSIQETDERVHEQALALVAVREAEAEAVAQMKEDLQALAEEYNAAYEAALNSLDGQFSLWEKAEEISATSTETMLTGLQSQLEYWNEYAANFEALMGRNIEGIEGFAQNFTDGSKESAEALAGLKNASDEEIAAIIAKMAETDAAKQSMAERFAALETDLDDRLEGIRDTFGETMEQLQGDADNVDFSTFESSVDEAFGFLEQRAAGAVAAVEDSLSKISASISSAGSSDTVGYNASGTAFWRGGQTWVGEARPELVSLPRGSQIIPAAESRELAAGSTTYNITVANIDELNEVVDWYESRRIRGRMG